MQKKRILGNRARSSSATQKCLGQFDKDYIPDKTIKAIQPFIENPDFVQKYQSGVQSLCIFVDPSNAHISLRGTVNSEGEHHHTTKAPPPLTGEMVTLLPDAS